MDLQHKPIQERRLFARLGHLISVALSLNSCASAPADATFAVATEDAAIALAAAGATTVGNVITAMVAGPTRALNAPVDALWRAPLGHPSVPEVAGAPSCPPANVRSRFHTYYKGQNEGSGPKCTGNTT